MSHETRHENDKILDELRPRMRAARIAHVRRLIAGVVIVPVLGFGAVAMAADGSDSPGTETASGEGVNDPAPDVELPDIGAADGAEANTHRGGDSDDDAGAARVSTTTSTTLAVEAGTSEVSLGALGWVEVEERDDGSLSMMTAGLADGWEVHSTEIADGKLVVVITNGEQIMMITIKPGVRDEISVVIDEVIIPPSTTTTEKPTHVEPTPAVTDRIVVEVPGKGSFVVERDGETLYLGNVQVNPGYTYDVIKAEGWKVYVAFTDGSWIWYGKAFINDDGVIVQHFWDEQKLPDPVYQWVEIPGVGAAKFKLYDGKIWVKELSPASGFGAWDYNQGSSAPTAKVDFEGEGVLWYIDVWINEQGEMAWTTTNASPTPTTTTTEAPPTTTTTEAPTTTTTVVPTTTTGGS